MWVINVVIPIFSRLRKYLILRWRLHLRQDIHFYPLSQFIKMNAVPSMAVETSENLSWSFKLQGRMYAGRQQIQATPRRVTSFLSAVRSTTDHPHFGSCFNDASRRLLEERSRFEWCKKRTKYYYVVIIAPCDLYIYSLRTWRTLES